jgi:hypothetical protein
MVFGIALCSRSSFDESMNSYVKLERWDLIVTRELRALAVQEPRGLRNTGRSSPNAIIVASIYTAALPAVGRQAWVSALTDDTRQHVLVSLHTNILLFPLLPLLPDILWSLLLPSGYLVAITLILLLPSLSQLGVINLPWPLDSNVACSGRSLPISSSVFNSNVWSGVFSWKSKFALKRRSQIKPRQR